MDMSSPSEGAAISTATDRRYDIDALRVLAFSLLILYHVGMFYVYDWGWHVKSAYQAEWLQLPMLWSNQWRMPLIFLISGLAVSFVWGKYRPLVFAGRRIWRLFIPLVFGMAIIVAPQAYLEGMTKGVIEPGFWHFFGQYLTFADYPAEAYGGAEIITWTWNHLLYLPYLLIYTLLLIPLALFLDGPGGRIRQSFRRMRGIWLIVLPIVPLMVYGNFIYPRFPYISHALFDDWYAHAMFFTFFLYGFLIGRDAGLWAELKRLRRLTLALAIAGFAFYYTISNLVPDNLFAGQGQLEIVVTYLNRWLWIVTVLGWGHHLLNRPFRWLPYATEAVYPWYMLHQTITVTVGYQLSGYSLGPVLEPLLLLTATFGGCFLIHEYIIRRTPLLRPLFGLPARRNHLLVKQAEPEVSAGHSRAVNPPVS
jgi:peptidoglycan/LPS O-acetylase OafA/YrhL